MDERPFIRPNPVRLPSRDSRFKSIFIGYYKISLSCRYLPTGSRSGPIASGTLHAINIFRLLGKNKYLIIVIGHNFFAFNIDDTIGQMIF